jgi:glycosyltransferase involved in cell wall biosynthesis
LAIPGRDLLIAGRPAAFAQSVNKLLAEPSLAARLGQCARHLATERYAWSRAARALEGFYRGIPNPSEPERRGRVSVLA